MDPGRAPTVFAAGLALAVGLAGGAHAGPNEADPVLASRSAQRSAIEDGFRKADADGNEKLSRKEADGLLAMDNAAFHEADKDKSGDLSKDEYVSWRIEAMQKDLLALGYGPGATDGNLGPHTLGALRRFARDEGLAGAGTGELIARLALKASDERNRRLHRRVGSEEPQRADRVPGRAPEQTPAGARGSGQAREKTVSEQGGKGPKPGFRELDLDHNGSLSWDEAQFSAPVRKHWNAVDANHDGKLNRAEFSALEGRVGETVGKSAARTPPSAPGGEGVQPPPSQSNAGNDRP